MDLLRKNFKSELTAFVKGNFFGTPFLSQNATQASAAKKPRIEFIDLAKGVCILLVVIFHSPRIDVTIPGVSALRMPLYFILSGLFFKTYGGFRQLFEKKINKIIIPFLFFIVVDLLFMAICKGTIDLKQFLYPVTDGQHLHNIPIWFLCSLFFSNLIFCAITLIARSSTAITISVGIATIVGLLLTANQIYLPLYLTQAINGLPFFYLGYRLRTTNILVANRFDRWNLPIAIGFLTIGIGICLAVGNTPRLDFFQNHFNGRPLLFYPVALAMVGGLIFLCKTIKWLPIISYIGRYSIVVLGLHQILLFHLRWVKLPFFDHKLMGWSLFAVVILICWIAIPLATRLIPWFTAQSDLIHFPTRKHHRIHSPHRRIRSLFSPKKLKIS